MQWHSKNEMYIGNWKFGLQHGHGKHIWIMDSNDDAQVGLSGTRYESLYQLTCAL